VAQSLAKLITHIIFSTKDRRALITPDIREQLNAYLTGILNNLDSPSIRVNCVADHAHVLCVLSRNRALADVVEEVKKASSKWIKTKGPAFRTFYWQAGYGAFSVSPSNVDAVRDYIIRQEEHHRKVTFQDELVRFLKRHGVDYDERYLWT